MLAVARSIIPQHAAICAGGWERAAGFPLRGRTLGLVGLGRVGQAVAVRAAAFRMRVLAHESLPDARFVNEHPIKLVPLDQLLSESDFVSLHIPLLTGSRHLIDTRALALMKPTSFLINTARGGLVCEDALWRALQERRIAGAGLDVFAGEPPPSDHPLLKLANVVYTAHTAGVDLQARDDMAMSAAKSIVAVLQGNWTDAAVVNPECREVVKGKS